MHRDIKPSNLILDGEARLRILDFGLARLEGQEGLTLSGDFIGTPLYMSPEQARRKKVPVDHRTDVYSLGATMYEALCGRPPFRGKDHADTLSQIIERDPAEPRKLNPRVPRDLETIVLKCLRKDAGERYRTAEALAQDLRRFVRGDSIEARPQSTLQRCARRALRQKGKIATCALAALLVVACALLVHGFARERRARELARRAAAHRAYDEAVLVQKEELLRSRTTLQAASESEKRFHRERFFLPTDFERIFGERNPAEEVAVVLKDLSRELPERFEAPYYLAETLLLMGNREEARPSRRGPRPRPRLRGRLGPGPLLSRLVGTSFQGDGRGQR